MMRSQNNGVRSSNLNAGNQVTCLDWCCGFMGWSSHDTEMDPRQQTSLSVPASNYVNATDRNSSLDGVQSSNNLLADNAQIAEAPNLSAPAKMVNPGQDNMVGEGSGQAKIASAPLKEVHNPQPAGGGSNSVSVGQQLDNIGAQTDNAGQVLQQDDSSSSLDQGPAAFDFDDY